MAKYAVSRKSEPAKMPLHGAPSPGRTKDIEELVQWTPGRHLSEALAVLRHLLRISNSDVSRLHRPLAHLRAKQGGLSCPVRADEAHDVSPAYPGRETLQQHPVSHGDTNVFRHQHLITAPRV